MRFVSHNRVTINLDLVTSIRSEKKSFDHLITFVHIPYINQSPVETVWKFKKAEQRDSVYEELNKKLQVEEI